MRCKIPIKTRILNCLKPIRLCRSFEIRLINRCADIKQHSGLQERKAKLENASSHSSRKLNITVNNREITLLASRVWKNIDIKVNIHVPSRRSMIVSKYLFRSATRKIDFLFVFYIFKWITFIYEMTFFFFEIDGNGMSNWKFMIADVWIGLFETKHEKNRSCFS